MKVAEEASDNGLFKEGWHGSRVEKAQERLHDLSKRYPAIGIAIEKAFVTALLITRDSKSKNSSFFA